MGYFFKYVYGFGYSGSISNWLNFLTSNGVRFYTSDGKEFEVKEA